MEELIYLFNRNHVRYLLVGGQAVRLEGMPRFSMDWDFFVPSKDLVNIAKINSLLEEELDMALLPLGNKGENFVQTYQTKWGLVQFHLGGPGLPPFDEAEKDLVVHETESGVEVKCLSAKRLLDSKKAAGRPQDQQDIEFLQLKLKK
jgi:hypothetical protein